MSTVPPRDPAERPPPVDNTSTAARAVVVNGAPAAAQPRTVDDDEHVATLVGVDDGAALLAGDAWAPLASPVPATQP